MACGVWWSGYAYAFFMTEGFGIEDKIVGRVFGKNVGLAAYGHFD